MSCKLAITVAGAVSLGSYEAGVLYEVIEAIAQHNRNPATVPDQKIFIDVLTGAAAGGISAALLTQKLLFEAGALDGAYTNALYSAWVQDLQFEPLMALQADEDPAKSILSSDYVDSVSEKYMTQRYSSNPTPPPNPHPALDPPASETFTFTDGGTFQNEPIGLAKNLVDDADPTHADALRFIEDCGLENVHVVFPSAITGFAHKVEKREKFEDRSSPKLPSSVEEGWTRP